MNFVRHKVSKNKRRYQEKGFDLDLTYVTERIIAMGFPSSKREAYFRNPLPEVQRFFETFHKEHYKLYNLCAERRYDPSKFHNRVEQFPFYDHNAPPITLIQECLANVNDWLKQDEKHVVGINCKAGKGRTGLIICCFLLETGMTTDEALKFYGEKRTKDGKGVTIASQIRYIRYYERLLKQFDSIIPASPKVILTKITFSTPPKLSGQPLAWIEIKNLVSHRSLEVEFKKKTKEYEIPIEGMVEGDVKIQVLYKQGRKLEKACHFWFNTGFLEGHELQLGKSVIDVANKDKKSKIFKNDFAITAYFKDYDPSLPEEQFNNWLEKSKAKQKEKKAPTNQGPEFTNDAEGNDTDSSFGTNQIDDDADEKPKKGKKKGKEEKPAPKKEEAKKEEVKKEEAKKEEEKKEEKEEKKEEKKEEEKKDEGHKEVHPEEPPKDSHPEPKSPSPEPKEGDEDDEEGRKNHPSFFKYGGYNLPLQISESDEESVDISENDPAMHEDDD